MVKENNLGKSINYGSILFWVTFISVGICWFYNLENFSVFNYCSIFLNWFNTNVFIMNNLGIRDEVTVIFWNTLILFNCEFLAKPRTYCIECVNISFISVWLTKSSVLKLVNLFFWQKRIIFMRGSVVKN